MLHRYSNFPGLSQLQTVTKELLQANDSDVEYSKVYKQRVPDGNTKTAYMTSTAEEFTQQIC
jgi:hypothetical protein